ncbi:MAG TPA: LysE family translocator [Steroidobacteraceae bacterium]
MISFGSLAVFCVAYLLATASPGPAVAAIVARTLSHGTRGITSFIAGFVVGDLIWFTLAATGMAMLAQKAKPVFLVVKYAGALYLLYLAYRSWTAPLAVIEADHAPPERSGRLFLVSLMITLGNPKVMVFFLALLPTIIDMREMGVALYLEAAVAMIVILSAVLTSYVLAAVRARRFFKSAHALRWVNRIAGTAIGGAAVAVATR